MSAFKITKADCDRVLAISKDITHDLSWSVKPNRAWVEASLPIKSEFPGDLELRITVNTILPSKFSFSILLNQIRIKSLDVNGSHSNKCTDQKIWAGETHKHDWSQVCPDGHAYTPTDITGSTVQAVLNQFCQECKIVFTGKYQPVPINAALPGV
jgi:hypothetical protein